MAASKLKNRARPPTREEKMARSTNKPRLVTFDELSEWQKDNEHILTGYVPESNSMSQVFKSLFFFHNESGNIYTHLIPSIIVLLCMVVSAFTPPFVLFGVGCMLCMGMSATFHTLKSHSLTVATLGNKLDYVGICILIAASMISLVGYAYDDMPMHHYVFVGLTSVFGVACTVVSLMEKFRSRHYRPIRAGMFVLYGLSGVLPVAAGCWEFGYQQAVGRMGCNWLYGEAFLYILGAFLYAVRFPERVKPGSYDYIGHSHQIFHVFVVLAAWCHYQALCTAYAASLQR